MPTRFFRISALTLALLAGSPAPASAQPGAFDPETGRDLLSYPRHPLVDYTHMKLNILIADMNVRRMQVVQELTFTAGLAPVESLTLDAKLMQVQSVTASTGGVSFEHDAQKLAIRFETPVPAGASCTLTTTYTVTTPPYGLVWTPQDPAWPGRAAQIHSKGEPENNSYWFPCHDFPNDRMTTEIIATVPAAYDVVSNGRLVRVENKALSTRESTGETTVDARLGMFRKFHWLQDKPHVPYLVTLVVGRWDVVDVGNKKMPMPVYAPVGRGQDVGRSFGRTAEMVDVFAKAFDEPYPWDQYAQVLVHNYSSGATENTSATSLSDASIYSEQGVIDSDPDGLVAHELAHQWFGDLVTCSSWEHIWLNEAWATYSEGLWFEHRDGPAGYEAHVFREFQSALGQDTGTAPKTPAMVSRQFRQPREVFTKAATPYAKGASVLHMLRRHIGDAAFFRGTAEYLNRFKFKQAETSDLQAVMEEASGESLDLFFAQWCYRPGCPRVSVKASWDAGASRLHLEARQTQKIDGPNPAFEFDLPVVARLSDGSDRKGVLAVRGRSATLEMELPSEPAWIAVDPDANILAQISIDAPASWLAAEARKGPSLAARAQAIRSLAKLKDERAAGLCEIVVFTPEEHELVKLEAIKALRTLKDAGTLETCVLGRPPSPAVREAAVTTLADIAAGRKDEGAQRGRDRAAEMLVKLYGLDRSTKVRAACISGLGTLKAVRHQPLILSAMTEESQSDRIRQGAVRALGNLNTPEGLAAVMIAAGDGSFDRTRPVAFDALVKMKEHDPDTVLELLAKVLDDCADRTRRAAGKALVDLGDPRGLDVLQRLIDRSEDRAEKQMLTDWLNELTAKVEKAAGKEDISGGDAPGDGTTPKGASAQATPEDDATAKAKSVEAK